MLLINDPKDSLDPRQQQDIETQEVGNNNADAPEQEVELDEEEEKTDYEQDDE